MVESDTMTQVFLNILSIRTGELHPLQGFLNGLFVLFGGDIQAGEILRGLRAIVLSEMN